MTSPLRLLGLKSGLESVSNKGSPDSFEPYLFGGGSSVVLSRVETFRPKQGERRKRED